jgi:hypothetical protein
MDLQGGDWMMWKLLLIWLAVSVVCAPLIGHFIHVGMEE